MWARRPIFGSMRILTASSPAPSGRSTLCWTPIRTAKVRIQVPNPDRLMRIGMFATATFHGRPLSSTAVPAAAILHLHDRDWVYVPAGDGKFRRVAVVAGAMVGQGKCRRSYPASLWASRW